jgi:cytidylate kinase
MEDIARRDEADSNRAVAPMKPAADAVVVDTTGLTLAEVVEHLAGLIEGRNE